MVGILSDSHDNLDGIKSAVRVFLDAGCTLVLHAGDFVAPFAARELQALGGRIKAVFGNCDGEKKGLEQVFQTLGEIKEPPFTFSHDGLRFLLTHVHLDVRRYAASREYDVVVFGHTHKPDVAEESGTLLINPGESGGWLSGRRTVALLEPATMRAEIIAL